MAEPYNIVEANRRAVQSGLALGAQMFSNSLQMQRLKSERALQQLRERQAAETLRFATFQHDQAIEQAAHDQKAAARFQAFTTPTLQMPADLVGPPAAGGGELGQVPVAVPNPEFIPDAGMAYMKAFLPGSQDPEKVVLNAATLQLRQAQFIKAQEDGSFEPSATSVTLPSGEVVEGVRTSKNAWQPMAYANNDVVEQGGEKFTRDRFGQLKRIPQNTVINKLTASQAEQIQRTNPDLLKYDAEKGVFLPDPAKTSEIQAALKVGAGITPATRTDVEKSMVDTDEALARAANALQVITRNPDAIGVVGMARSAGERVAGQLGVPTDARIAKARNQLGQDFVGLAQGLRLDSGNMSYYERRKLEAIGDPTRWTESDQTAKDMMANIQAALIGKKLRQLKTLGRPIDLPTLAQIPFEELPGLYDSDLIGDAELLALAQAKRITPNQAREIRAKKAKG